MNKEQQTIEQKIQASIELESELISAYLSDTEEMRKIELEISEDIFTHPMNKRIAKVILHNKKRKTVNTLGTITTTFREVYKEKDIQDEFIAYIKQVSKITINTEYALDIIAKLKEYAFRNFAVMQAREIVTTATESEDINELVEVLRNTLTKAYSFGKANTMKKFSDVAREFLEEKDDQVINKTGYNTIDSETDGFKGGQLITIGAGSGVGKSTIALNLVNNINKNHLRSNNNYTGVVFFSMEMTNEEVVGRWLAINT